MTRDIDIARILATGGATAQVTRDDIERVLLGESFILRQDGFEIPIHPGNVLIDIDPAGYKTYRLISPETNRWPTPSIAFVRDRPDPSTKPKRKRPYKGSKAAKRASRRARR